MKHEELSEKIIGVFYDVYNTLGYGFLELVYHNAMIIELRKRGISVKPRTKIDVLYDGIIVGNYECDILVEDKIILELKAVERFAREHDAQLINYLKASAIDVGLLLNFGPKPEFKRKIFETARAKTQASDPREFASAPRLPRAPE